MSEKTNVCTHTLVWARSEWLTVPKWYSCISLIRTIAEITSGMVFTAGACSAYPLSCNLAYILLATGVLLRVSATNLESVIGGISTPHTPCPHLLTQL